MIDVPVPVSMYQRVEGIEGRLIIMDALANPALVSNNIIGLQPSKLLAFDLKKKELQTIAPRVTDIDISFDRKKMLLRNDKQLSIADATTGPLSD